MMHRTWYENTDLLDRFRQWLARTAEELAELNADQSPGNPLEDATFGGTDSPVANQDESSFHASAPGTVDLDVTQTVGWLQLVESFTALRHELKLQTKSARGLDDNVRAALSGLESASRQFQSVQAQEAQAAERAAQPFVEALIGLDESLERCGRALEAMQSRVAAEGPQRLLARLDERFRQQSGWRRWWSRHWHDAVIGICRAEAAAAQQQMWQGLMEGFELVRVRLRRAMDDQQVRRIPCLGRLVDANRMTVVELVDAPGVPPESVVAELRPGYTWRDRIIRFAEVRAARPSAPDSAASSFENGGSEIKKHDT